MSSLSDLITIKVIWHYKNDFYVFMIPLILKIYINICFNKNIIT